MEVKLLIDVEDLQRINVIPAQYKTNSAVGTTKMDEK